MRGQSMRGREDLEVAGSYLHAGSSSRCQSLAFAGLPLQVSSCRHMLTKEELVTASEHRYRVKPYVGPVLALVRMNARTSDSILAKIASSDCFCITK